MRPHVALSEARSRAGRRTIGSSSFVDRRDERCCIARKAFPAAQLQMEPSFTSSGKGDTRLWEVAVLFHLRDAFRSGDVWLAHSRRYGDLKQVLVPMIAAQENAKLAVPSNPQDWLADRKARLTIALKRLARAARNGTIPHGSIEDGTLRIDRLTADVPDGAEALILDLYRRMPSVRITDMLLEVDAALGFTDAFTHLRTGAPCRDRIGLLNVLLAEGLNLGLRKMAEATNTHDYWQLSRLARWHVESEAMNQALAIVVAAQGKLPMSRVWGWARQHRAMVSFSRQRGMAKP